MTKKQGTLKVNVERIREKRQERRFTLDENTRVNITMHKGFSNA